jgi:hypothetical protein
MDAANNGSERPTLILQDPVTGESRPAEDSPGIQFVLDVPVMGMPTLSADGQKELSHELLVVVRLGMLQHGLVRGDDEKRHRLPVRRGSAGLTIRSGEPLSRRSWWRSIRGLSQLCERSYLSNASVRKREAGELAGCAHRA